MDLKTLQHKISELKLDAFFIPRNNLFLGQDILWEENKLMELTGFTGSAGSLLVLADKAFLFVDGRYEIQAELETSRHDVTVICQKGNLLQQWLSDNIPTDGSFKLGFNPWCLSIKDIDQLTNKFPHLSLVAVTDEICGPILSPNNFKVFSHDITYAGLSSDEKIAQILTCLENNQLDAYLFTAADSVSWLLNLRYACLPDTPILRAFTLLDKNGKIYVFGDNLDTDNLSDNLSFYPLAELPKILGNYKKQNIGIDTAKTPHQIETIFQKYSINGVRTNDFCAEQKVIKNPVELQGIRNAHLRDGVAIVQLLHWLEQNWLNKTELDVVDKLFSFRKKKPLFYSNSFETIAACDSNGAIVHYHPTIKSNLAFQEGSLLLLDSGAQYYDGTTDITRTIALGEPSPEMIDNFTMVLKAHINISRALFPPHTSGQTLDCLSRSVLWQCGKDYNHGTGHGVGCFLNVHEGPIGITSGHSPYGLEKGMVTSIEPGYYLKDKFGIRIENLVEVIFSTEHPEMLCFSSLTMVPFDKKLINKQLLNTDEIAWINHYHKNVYHHLQGLLDKKTAAWLQHACAEI